jgi:hypothetical protein
MHAYVRKILKNCPYCMSLICKTTTKNVLLIAYYTDKPIQYSKMTISVLLSYRNIYRVIDDRLVASRPEVLEITIVTVDIYTLPQKQIHQDLIITLRTKSLLINFDCKISWACMKARLIYGYEVFSFAYHTDIFCYLHSTLHFTWTAINCTYNCLNVRYIADILISLEKFF